MAEVPQWSRTNAIKATATVAEALAGTLTRYNVRSTHGAPVAAACIAATICDGLVAVMHVIDSHGQAHAGTIVRSLVDSMLDLELLCSDPNAMDSLRMATTLGQIHAGQAFLAMPDLSPEGRHATEQALVKQRAIHATLKARGVKRLRTAERFASCPKSLSLLPAYWVFTSSTHGDLQALANRHVREGHLTMGETLSDEHVQSALTFCVAIAMNVYEFAPHFLEVTADELAPQWQALISTMEWLANAEAMPI